MVITLAECVVGKSSEREEDTGRENKGSGAPQNI